MNKLLFGAAVMGITVSIASTAVYAATNPKMTISTENKSTGLPYNVADGIETELPVSGDFFSIKNISNSNEYTEKKFSITSASTKEVDAKLVLTAEIVGNSQYSTLDYYDIKLADNEGNYIYNCEDESETGKTELEIELGKFNSSFNPDKKEYILYCKVNPEVSQEVAKSDAVNSKLALSLKVTPLARVLSTQTQAPTSVSGVSLSPATDAPSAPTATAEADGYTEKTYVCGKDIEPGRYLVDGNAKIKITHKADNEVKEFVVTDGTVGDFEGVEKFLVILEKGDTVTVGSLVPGKKAEVHFTNASVKESPSPSPKATAAASSTSKNNTSSKTSATASKTTNPKTGDDGIAIPAIFTVMILSAGFVGALEVLKRKNLG